MEYQGQHGHAADHVDECGNNQVDGARHDGAATSMGACAGAAGDGHVQKTDGVLQRSGSSSSEDDGTDARRKKGIKEKIREKIPGGQKESRHTIETGGPYVQQGNAGMTGTGTAVDGSKVTGEKKGLVDKIKEKIPRQH